MLHRDSQHQVWLFRMALVALTLLAHAAVCTHDFINVDDPLTLYDNPRLKPPSVSNALYYWRNRGLELYIPVTYTVWSAIASLSAVQQGSEYALRPIGFHWASLCCHALSVLVVFEILSLILISQLPAAIGAALFAVHPLQVEAIAWATSLKDVLSGLAALTAIWQYLLAMRRRSLHTDNFPRSLPHYPFAIFAFIIAVLSKPAGVAAIGVAAILDRNLFQTTWSRILFRLLPWLVIACVAVLIARHVQPGAEVKDNPPLLRPLIALDALSFYLWKICCPLWLSPDYGRRPTQVIETGYIAWTWIIPTAASCYLWSIRRKHQQLPIAAAVCFAALLPTLGLVPFIYQQHSTVADRYAYLAMLGPALSIGACVARWHRTQIPAALLIVLLAGLSVREESYWTDSVHLFAHAVAVSPDAPSNHLNFGNALAIDQQFAAAAEQYRKTLELAPQNTQAHDNYIRMQQLAPTSRGGPP